MSYIGKQSRESRRTRLAFKMVLAILGNDRTILENPKVVMNIMSDAFALADRWMEACDKENGEVRTYD